MFNKEKVERATQYLQSVGSIQSFKGSVDWVVLDPSFLIKVMTCIVSVTNIVISNGIFFQDDLPRIFDAIHGHHSSLQGNISKEGNFPHQQHGTNGNPELHEFALKVLQQFDLVFPLQEKKQYLVPWLLPSLKVFQQPFPLTNLQVLPFSANGVCFNL